MTKIKYLLKCITVALFPTLAASPTYAATDDCSGANVKQIEINVDTAAITRVAVPQEIFGFNVPWRDFQLGYVRDGSIRTDLYPYLMPFKGALYRYPGGSPSNNFEWKKAVGPIRAREAFLADFENFSQANFGVDEFAHFVNKVNGRALLTLNISGPVKAQETPIAAKNDAVALLNYIRHSSPFKCIAGTTCPVAGVELGNELDFGAYAWSAQRYAKQALAVVDGVNATSGLSGINWVAAGRTAPWSFKDFDVYNETLATRLASKVQGIAIHPYYDGISVPNAMRYVTSFGKTWTAKRNDGSVYVTEHARWPSMPQGGNWKSNWYQATGIGGAISSVDFLMSLISQPIVAAGNWHALGLAGPWQLIRVNDSSDSLYASPVYWGMLAAREAFLDNLVSATYRAPESKPTYAGGYDVKMIGMASADNSAVSIIGVNRNPRPYKIKVIWSGHMRNSGEGTLRTVSSPDPNADNTDAAQTAITMLKSVQVTPAGRTSSNWCVPAQSVFSILEP